MEIEFINDSLTVFILLLTLRVNHTAKEIKLIIIV